MRPKWNAPAAAACALVVATLGACGGGSEKNVSGDADLAAESFALPDGATLEDLAKVPAVKRPNLPAYAVTGTVDVRTGKEPVAVAVNEKTNKVYIANKKSDNVTVLDGKTNKILKTVDVGPEPNAVTVNPLTNKIYVVSLKGEFKDGSLNPNGNGTVSVIDGATDKAVRVEAGLEPYALAINKKTNKIYVANQGSNDVTVINGKTNKTSTIQLRPDDATDIYDGVLTPQDVEVNEVTNTIYVCGSQSNTVAKINGKTNRFTTLKTEELPAIEGAPTASLATSQTGITPTAMVVDDKRDLLYVTELHQQRR